MFPFTISMGDGSTYVGNLNLKHQGHEDSSKKYHSANWNFICHVNRVQTLSGKLSINGEKEKGQQKTRTLSSTRNQSSDWRTLQSLVSKDIYPVEGKITITFEPLELCNDYSTQPEKLFDLTNYFNKLNINPRNNNDIKLVVQDHEFPFNRDCLSNISSVFKEMFENCTPIDENPPDGNLPDRNLPIPDESIQTIQTLKRILDGNSIRIGKNPEITVDLFKFADKFNIQPLVKACGDYFAKYIKRKKYYDADTAMINGTCVNLFELAIIANRADDEPLMKKLATLISSVKDDDSTRNFVKNNFEKKSPMWQFLALEMFK